MRGRLEALRKDYLKVQGSLFQHFFCPFLYRDEDVDLCAGHILNQAFGVGTQVWVPQRKDVDEFFGSRFEADFTKLKYRNALKTHDVLGDRRLKRELRPRLLANDRQIDFFVPESKIPDQFSPIHSTEDRLPSLLGLKLPPQELENLIDADWRIEIDLDLRVASLVALLKAAHLTQFALLGYRYTFSPSGYLMGRQLGKIFQECNESSREEAQRFAIQEFATNVNMVRPLLGANYGLRGTILDGKSIIAWSASGFPWAIIVLVPTGDTLNGVMLPVGDTAERVATWHSFMSNDNESIVVKIGHFEQGIGWQISKKSWRVQWPKTGNELEIG